MASPTKQAARRPFNETRTVEIIKRAVVGTVELGENGDVDLLEHLASVAMHDARNDMNPDRPSKSTYEVEDDLGVTSVTIEHTPNGAHATPQPLSVADAKLALREAQRRERDGEYPVA